MVQVHDYGRASCRPPGRPAARSPPPSGPRSAGILEQLIDTELTPGDAIPSERALVVRLGVSRVTVRQAIADLVEPAACWSGCTARAPTSPARRSTPGCT